MIVCKDCKYNGSIFEFCDDHRKSNSRKFNVQYDELYKYCTTQLPALYIPVELGNSGIKPPTLNEMGMDDTSLYMRSDIPAPEFFLDNVKQLKGYVLQPKDIKIMLEALKNPEKALASWNFNQTFDTGAWLVESLSRPQFEEVYDEHVVNEIMRLLPKLKKIKRIR
jgi:hypothetical protein